jgi:type II secretory pathway pseudopilin PulG
VKEQKANSMNTHHAEQGFSLLEMVIVVMVIMIIAAMAIFQLQPALATARADSAMRQVIDELRQAREYSVAKRRYVQVTFTVVPVSGQTQYQVQTTEMDTLTAGAGGVNPVLRTVWIEGPMTFYVTPGMTDTPDGYGNSSPIYFGGVANGPPAGMLFQSDGELVAAVTYLPINGSVFLGVNGTPGQARAVTVLGTTGRVRGWRASGTGWNQF